MVDFEDRPQRLHFPLTLVLVCLRLPEQPLSPLSLNINCRMSSGNPYYISGTLTRDSMRPNVDLTSSCPRAPPVSARSAPSPLVAASCSDAAPELSISI